MNILEVNKFFYERGGVETVLFETIDGLRQRGHQVVEFSMHDKRNRASAYEKFFIKQIPELLSPMSLGNQARLFRHFLYSPQVERKLGALIRAEKPVVAHVHSAYHHLSASLFTTLKKYKIPIVYTVHDAFVVSANRTLMLGGEPRPDLLLNKTFNTIVYKSVEGRLMPSIGAALERWYYQARGIWNSIDAFITPSKFYKDLLVQGGIDGNKISVVPNPFPIQKETKPAGQGVLYLGRLHAEKGVGTLLEAAKLLPAVQFVVAGDGPLRGELERDVAENKLSNVQLVGQVSGAEREKVLSKAKVVVVPSQFYENCSLTILEAAAAGRILVVSDRGGNSEHVVPGETGFVFAAGNASALAASISSALALTPAAATAMIQKSRAKLEESHSTNKYFERLEGIFNRLVR